LLVTWGTKVTFVALPAEVMLEVPHHRSFARRPRGRPEETAEDVTGQYALVLKLKGTGNLHCRDSSSFHLPHFICATRWLLPIILATREAEGSGGSRFEANLANNL
jgi:hypothetical protein